MKKFILILISVVHSFSVLPQDYNKFPVSTDAPIWGMYYKEIDYVSNQTVESYKLLTLYGDTIIRDSLYQKIYSLKDTIISPSNINEYLEAIREGTDKKIYKIEQNDSDVKVLMDFSLSIGQSVIIDQYYGIRVNATLSKKEPIVLNGKAHTKYTILSTWIDGVGDIFNGIDLTYPPIAGSKTEHFVELKSMKLNNELIIGNYFNSYLTTSIPNISTNPEISFSIDKSLNLLNLQHNKSIIKNVSLINALGIEVINQNFNQNKANIRLSDNLKGIYIVKIQDYLYRFYCKKIIL